MVVVLDDSILNEINVTAGLKPNGLLIINTPKNREDFDFDQVRLAVADVTGLAEKAGLKRGVVNTGIIGAFAKIACVRLAADSAFILHRTDGGCIRAGIIGHVDKGFEVGRLVAHLGNVRNKFLMVNARHHVGVVEYVKQLLFDIAVVHVDRHRTQLEAGEHALQVFVAVVQVQANMVTGADTLLRSFIDHTGWTVSGVRTLLASPLTAAACALTGRVTNPREIMGAEA